MWGAASAISEFYYFFISNNNKKLRWETKWTWVEGLAEVVKQSRSENRRQNDADKNVLLGDSVERRRQESNPLKMGRKKKKKKGIDVAVRLPTGYFKFKVLVTPNAKCRLRYLRLERIIDYLIMEEEFIQNQEKLKPQDETKEKELNQIDKIRGSPMQ